MSETIQSKNTSLTTAPKRPKGKDLLRSMGYFRLALAAPTISLGNGYANAQAQIRAAREAEQRGADLVVFPELSLCGCSLGNLTLNEVYRESALQGLRNLRNWSKGRNLLIVTGLPYLWRGRLLSLLALLRNGEIKAFMPAPAGKNLPYYRCFQDCPLDPAEDNFILWEEESGNKRLPLLPLAPLALSEFPEAGLLPCFELDQAAKRSAAPASSLVNIHFSCLPATRQKRQQLETYLSSRSAQEGTAEVLISVAAGEAGNDYSFSGLRLAYEDGSALAPPLEWSEDLLLVDLDIDYLRQRHAAKPNPTPLTKAFCLSSTLGSSDVANAKRRSLLRPNKPLPFLAASPEQRPVEYEQIFQIQAQGLKQRLERSGLHKVIIGLSGGLDSCLALLSAGRCAAAYPLSLNKILCVSMPGFGSSSQTRQQAQDLAELLRVDFREISIVAACEQHFRDIEHNHQIHDACFENAQARERTQILMDLANKEGALVLGTGDLSELALGWCTYNGDQMSMYALNAAIPKTLVRDLVQYESERYLTEQPALSALLTAVLQTPVSPELLPPVKETLSQKTEDIIGPYILHDFFLWHFLGRQASPRKLFYLAQDCFGREFDPGQIKQVLGVFLRRFLQNQFKREAMPNGPALDGLNLSPRAGFYLPADLEVKTLLDDYGRI